MAPAAGGSELSGPEARAARRQAAKALLKSLSSDEEDEAEKKTKRVPEVNSVHHGTVVSLTSYGAFVSLGDDLCDGLAHVSQLTAGRAGRNLRDPEEVLAVGDRVWALVTEVKDNKKVALSLKALNQETGKPREPKAPTSKGAGSEGADAKAKTPKDNKASKAAAKATTPKEEVAAKSKQKRTTHGGTLRRNGALTQTGRELMTAKEKADKARRKAEAAKAATRVETAERAGARLAAGKKPKARQFKHKRHKEKQAKGLPVPKPAQKHSAKAPDTSEEKTKRAEKRARQKAKQQAAPALPEAKRKRAAV